ncbi:MAG: tetratricopeptide repeat protein, partial [Phycisphaerales bacterium]
MSRRYRTGPLVIICILIGGCAARPTTEPPPGEQTEFRLDQLTIDPALSAVENLQRWATVEAGSTEDLVPLEPPVPPGVAPEVLQEWSDQAPKARMPLREAIAEVAATVQLPQPVSERLPEIDSATRDEATRHYIRGRDAALRQDYRLAVRELDQAILLNPGNPTLLLNSAQNHLAAGQAEEALARYEQLILIEPDNSEARFTLALADAARHQFVSATAHLSVRMLAGQSFNHDALADVLAYHVLWRAMSDLGYDRASIEAGLAVLKGIETVSAPTRYRQRALPVYQTRGVIRRAIGDAHCRLGEYGEARQAYAEAVSVPTPDPAALHPRVIYADLRLGRIFDAQVELMAALEIDHPSARGQVIRLCRYLARHVSQRELLAEAAVRRYRSGPDDAHHARCAAALLDEKEAEALLEEYLQRHPEEVAAAADLLRRLGSRDAAEATARAVALTKARPDLADRFAQHLMVSVASPARAIAALQALEASPARAIVEARLLAECGALGEAWSVCEMARRMFPDDVELLVRQIELAGLLEEPELIDALAPQVAEHSAGRVWLARSRARTAVEQTDLAVSDAVVAVEAEPENPETIIGLAAA